MSKATILYVEDNIDNRTLVKRVLMSEDYVMAEASNATEALETIDKQRPDLILMDISMPEVDGYALTTKIKNMPGLQTVPILALTANVMRGDREKSLEAGCDGYIQKPIDIDSLPQTIERYLQKAVISDTRKPVITETREPVITETRESVITETREPVITEIHEPVIIDTSETINEVSNGTLLSHQRSIPQDATILVVEDNVFNFVVIARMLGTMGIHCEWKTSGYEVVEYADTLPHLDLILMDIHLPYEDGYGALKKIRAAERFKEIPIVAVTADASHAQLEKSRSSGFDGFLGKPLDPDRFPEQIRRALTGEPVWEIG